MNVGIDFITKWGELLLQCVAALMYYKSGQVLISGILSRLGVRKRDNFYYKVGQVLQSRAIFTK